MYHVYYNVCWPCRSTSRRTYYIHTHIPFIYIILYYCLNYLNMILLYMPYLNIILSYWIKCRKFIFVYDNI